MSSPHLPLSLQGKVIRRELFGDDGIPQLAEAIGLPVRTWQNCEAGVSIPATALLRFIDHTGVAPRWLLTGEGDRYTSVNGHQMYAR